jgi:DNA-binding transcriptional MerR regulator
MVEHMFDLWARFWYRVRSRGYPPAVAGPDAPSVLGRGIYTVRETVRILRPTLTSRKVHYWMDEGILTEPIRWGRRGVPTLLSYNQVLRIRILQQLRDDLGFTLKKSREALAWITEHVTAEQWVKISFFRTGAGEVGITDGHERFSIPARQEILEGTLPELEAFLERARAAWEHRVLPIEGYSLLVSDPQIQAGSPVIAGTRIETSFIAHLAPAVTVRDLHKMYPQVGEGAFEQAAKFEDVELAA